MQPTKIRLTVFRLILAVAVAALILHVVTDLIKRRAREHYDHCMQVADWHMKMGDEYRSHSQNGLIPGMSRIAAWHAYMGREFERAARQPWRPTAQSLPFPPQSWVDPADYAPAKP